MAACGASDSVITHTSISEELQVPLLLLFSISLHQGGGLGGPAQQNHAFFSPQHNIINLHYLSHRRTAAEETLANENGKKWKKRSF